MALAPPTFNFITPQAPSSLIAMTVTSAAVAIPQAHNAGRCVLLHNTAAGVCYVAFGALATLTTGYAIEPNSEVGPIGVPEGETQLSAILLAATGTLRVTYGTFR
jgi:hypothetical protein